MSTSEKKHVPTTNLPRDNSTQSIIQDASALFMFAKDKASERDISTTSLSSALRPSLAHNTRTVPMHTENSYHQPVHHHATLKSIIAESNDSNNADINQTPKEQTAKDEIYIHDTRASDSFTSAMISQKNKDNTKKKDWPVPDSYIVDPDAGTITCVCGYDEDDGFTIQCDHCFRWQHAICYNIKDMDTVPDDYLCNVCNPRNIDIKLAKQIQKRRFSSFSLTDEASNVTREQTDRKKRRTDAGQTFSTNNKNENFSHKDTSKEPTSGSAPPYDLIRKKEHLINAKDAFPAVYIAIDNCTFKEPLVANFLQEHKEDTCIQADGETKWMTNNSQVKPYSSIVYSRTFPGFNKLGVFASQSCEKGTYMCEIVGELYFKTQYLEDPKNQYRIWGMPKRKVLFHDTWPLVIDQRLCGNESRYLRKSCQPNVELVTLKSEDGIPRFWYRTLRYIEEDEELHAAWQWSKNHPMIKIVRDGIKFTELTTEEKDILLESVDVILSACECACGNNNKDCHLMKVKKIINSYCKTVKLKMNNRYKFNEVVAKLTSHQRKREPPILQRMLTENKRQQDICDIIPHGSQKEEMKLPSSTVVNSVDFERLLTPRKILRSAGYEHNMDKNGDSSILLNYNEDKVDELDDLPIPIELPVDVTDLKEDVRQPDASSAGKIDTHDIFKDSKTESETHNNSHPADVISRSSTPGGAPSIQTEYAGEILKEGYQFSSAAPSKKKLSFADYKKKLSK